jgi:SsrA-binding protein
MIVNRKARAYYHIVETYKAGISLLGGEVKAVRKGACDLSNAYVKIVGGEVYLVNANIPIDGKKDYNPARSRKLLLNRSEIVSLETKSKSKKLTLIPVKMYNLGRLIKLEIALARRKRGFEVKEEIKKRDLEKEALRELKDIGNV